MDIICRWRDAITDPPAEGIMCIVRRGDIRDHRFRFGGLWFDPGGDNFDPAAVTDGDQWLDITDVPAVAVAKVQAAVDEMDRFEARCAEKNSAYEMGRKSGFMYSADIVKDHTGVTPSEVAP